MRIKFTREFNPLIVKELRSSMRGIRSFATLTGVLLTMAGISYLILKFVSVNPYSSQGSLSSQVGQAIFVGQVFFLLFLVSALTPALTSNAISKEHEKGTYDMLIITPLEPVHLVLGKLIASLSYIFLVIIAVVPMFSLVSVFGGIDLWTILKALIVIITSTLLFGIIGIFFSTLLRSNNKASAISYLVLILLMFAPILISAVPNMLYSSPPSRWLLAISPISALTSALAPTIGQPTYVTMYSYFFLGSLPDLLNYTPLSLTSIPRPIYHYSLSIFGLISVLLFFASVQIVRPIHRMKIRWTECLLFCIVLLGYLGIIAMLYAGTTSRYEQALTHAPVSTPPTESIPAPSLKGP